MRKRRHELWVAAHKLDRRVSARRIWRKAKFKTVGYLVGQHPHQQGDDRTVRRLGAHLCKEPEGEQIGFIKALGAVKNTSTARLQPVTACWAAHSDRQSEGALAALASLMFGNAIQIHCRIVVQRGDRGQSPDTAAAGYGSRAARIGYAAAPDGAYSNVAEVRAKPTGRRTCRQPCHLSGLPGAIPRTSSIFRRRIVRLRATRSSSIRQTSKPQCGFLRQATVREAADPRG
jgi:hypothetical protein